MCNFVRLSWFVFTIFVYYFIDSAFKSAGTNSFIRLFVFLIYFFFIYFIPRNAFISMFENKVDRKKQKCDALSNHIQRLSLTFLKENDLNSDIMSQCYVWSSLLFTISDIIVANDLQSEIDSAFRSTFSNLISDSSVSLDICLHARNDFTLYCERFINTPHSEDGIRENFIFLMQLLSGECEACPSLKFSQEGLSYLSAVKNLHFLAASAFSLHS